MQRNISVGTDPDATVYDPATRQVFVMNAHSDDVSVVDVAGRREALRMPAGGTAHGGRKVPCPRRHALGLGC